MQRSLPATLTASLHRSRSNAGNRSHQPPPRRTWKGELQQREPITLARQELLVQPTQKRLRRRKSFQRSPTQESARSQISTFPSIRLCTIVPTLLADRLPGADLSR